MRKLSSAYPNDMNAKAILALALDRGYETVTKKPRDGTEESIALLKAILGKEPDHVGAHHFLIHAYEDSPQAREAWKSSETYPKLVPNIPHALHMPGHIYVQTGRSEDALKAFEAAGANERHYMDADPHYPHDHYFHNQQYLIYTLGALGRYADAINESRKLMAVPENPGERGALDGTSSYRIGWFSLMRTLVRFEKWDEILDGKTLPFQNQPPELLWYHWARGLAYASTSNLAAAGKSLQMMEAFNPVPPQFRIAQDELAGYIDASSGDVKWETPLGQFFGTDNIPEFRKFGSISLGGPMVTAGGLVFMAGTLNPAIFAFDVERGVELWKADLPTSARATPMTYRGPDGKQYVVICAGGHGIAGGPPLGDYVIALALP